MKSFITSLLKPSSTTEEAVVKELTGETSGVFHDAAKAIAEADFLFVGTGAGFSADSGLAVYKDVANHEVYKKLGLTYLSLAQPKMLEQNPELFHGFWLKCANDYRNMKPNDGYYIIKKWKEQLFTAPYETKKMNSKEALELVTQMKTNNGTTTSVMGKEEEGQIELVSVEQEDSVGHNPIESASSKAEFYDTLFAKQAEYLKIHGGPNFLELGSEVGYSPARGVAGPFFSYTSNVDGHFQRMFNNHEVFEIHGSIDYFQCSKQCTRKAWPLPMEKRFKISKEMTVVKKQLKIQKQPFDEAKGITYDSFDSYTVPICQYCGVDARPNILLFGDGKWFTSEYAANAHNSWTVAMLSMLAENPQLKVVVLEIGAGDNVPSVRYECENVFEKANFSNNGSTTFIRINPEIPEYGSRQISSLSGFKRKLNLDKFISIKSKGLDALKKIDKHLQEILKKKSNHQC